MANSIALVTKFLPLMDETYKENLLTKDLETTEVKFDGSNAVKVYKSSISGLKNYARNTGFTAGDVTGTWETLTLAQDRGITFSIDNMDNDETLGLAFGKTSGQLVREKVAPEVDMYRFGKMAKAANILTATAAALSTGANVLAAIETAETAMDEQEVPAEGRILYITPTLYGLLKQAAGTRFAAANGTDVNFNFATFDGMKIIKVPQSRFYVGTQYNATTQAIEAEVNDSKTQKINFMIVHPSAIVAIAKVAKLRIFTPEENQTADAYKVDYRLYHDEFVLDNKVKGIYLHKAVAA